MDNLERIEEKRTEMERRKRDLAISRMKIRLSEYGIKRLEVEAQLANIEKLSKELESEIKKQEEELG